MSTDLSVRSVSGTTQLSKAAQFNIQETAARTAEIAEVTKVANHEVAKIGVQAVASMADVTRAAGDIHRRLTMEGHRDEVFDDAKSKVLQVTGQNLITMANAGQKEVMQQASRAMR